MIRTWQADPSHQIELEDGVYPVVTQDDLLKAVVDGAIMVSRSGGCLNVAVVRKPTGVPNEYVTVGALVTWRDRTDAKPQPERAPEPPLAEAPEGTYPAAEELRNTIIPKVDRAGNPLPIDDGLAVDPDAIDESDPELQAALRG